MNIYYGVDGRLRKFIDENKNWIIPINGGSKYRWANDGIRNYRWPLDKALPDNMKFGQVRNKKNSGN